MRIHHVLRVPENVLLFGEARDLERGLHFFERGVPFVGGFCLIELHECNEKFCLVLAEPESRRDFGNALVRQILVAVHHAADKIFRFETDFVRKHAKRKGRVRLFLPVIIVPQKFPVVQVFEDFSCRFLFGHALNVRKKFDSENSRITFPLSRNNDKLEYCFKVL